LTTRTTVDFGAGEWRNVGGNRRADEMLAEDQTVCRRVRLTVRLAVARLETGTPQARITRGMENRNHDNAVGLGNMENAERKATN
jgi:hypothetical protein